MEVPLALRRYRRLAINSGSEFSGLVLRYSKQPLSWDRSALRCLKLRLGNAPTYLRNQQGSLSTFLKNPRLPIRNDGEGRDLRHIIVDRKNWRVFASDRDYQLSLQREPSGTVSDSIRAGSNGVTLVFP